MIAVALLLFAADIPESQLVTEVNGKEVFAPAFRGVWSKDAASCKDEDSVTTIEITETRLSGYEWDSVLLKTTPMILSWPKSDERAMTVNVLTADRGETQLFIGKKRISLLNGKLYMSPITDTDDDDESHFNAKSAKVRCR